MKFCDGQDSSREIFMKKVAKREKNNIILLLNTRPHIRAGLFNF